MTPSTDFTLPAACAALEKQIKNSMRIPKDDFREVYTKHLHYNRQICLHVKLYQNPVHSPCRLMEILMAEVRELYNPNYMEGKSRYEDGHVSAHLYLGPPDGGWAEEKTVMNYIACYAEALQHGHAVEVNILHDRVMVTDYSAHMKFSVKLSADRLAMLRDTILTAMRREQAGEFS